MTSTLRHTMAISLSARPRNVPFRTSSLVIVAGLAVLQGCDYDQSTGAVSDTSEMTTYIVAVKREKRTEAPPSWIEELGKTSGVNLEQVSNSRRAQVQATEDGIRAVREKYGSFLRVEEKINHSAN